jgi:hypothetical protein
MPNRRLVRDPERYKTTPCRNGWNDPNNCPYGWRCQHAHCKEELRKRSLLGTYTPPPPPPSTVQSPVSIITEIETLAPSTFELNVPPLPIGPPPPLSESPSPIYSDDKKATSATSDDKKETTSDENDVETLATDDDDIEPFMTSEDTNHNEPATTSDDTDDTNETLDYLDTVLATFRGGE